MFYILFSILFFSCFDSCATVIKPSPESIERRLANLNFFEGLPPAPASPQFAPASPPQQEQVESEDETDTLVYSGTPIFSDQEMSDGENPSNIPQATDDECSWMQSRVIGFGSSSSSTSSNVTPTHDPAQSTQTTPSAAERQGFRGIVVPFSNLQMNTIPDLRTQPDEADDALCPWLQPGFIGFDSSSSSTSSNVTPTHDPAQSTQRTPSVSRYARRTMAERIGRVPRFDPYGTCRSPINKELFPRSPGSPDDHDNNGGFGNYGSSKLAITVSK